MDQIVSNIMNNVITANVRQPFIVYIGVGSAASTFTMIDNHKVVTPDAYHQFPSVLHDMTNHLKHVKKHIVLIDGLLENPPHITQDPHNELKFIKVSDTYYKNDANLVYVHCLQQFITHDAFELHGEQQNLVNITQSLTELITFCKQESINLIYHDFSGQQTLPLFSYYEKLIGDDHDRIIIGLGAQGDFGCYVDLTSPIATFAMKPHHSYDTRDHIKICSPRYYLNNNMTLELALHDYPDCNWNILHEQFTRICKDKFDELVSKVFYKLRFLKQIQKKNEFDMSQANCEEICKMFGDPLGAIILQRFEEKQFDMGFIEALEFYGPQYECICIHNKLPYSSVDLLYQITSNAKDEYSWAGELRKYINY